MIDLTGNRTFDEQTIAVYMQALINGKYRPAQREQLTRGTVTQKKELTAFYAVMSKEKARIEADNTLLKATLAHEAAQARLTKDVLVASKDIPATVDSTDMKGVVTQVPNPLLLADADERKAAQAIIDGATAPTLALAATRAKAALAAQVVV